MALVFPFNFNPESTIQRDNAGFTIPAGQYGYVSYSLSATIGGRNGGDAQSNVANGDSQTGSMWLAADDVITTAVTNPTAGASTAEAVLSVNGTKAAVARAEISGTLVTISGGGGDVFYSVALFDIP